MNFYKGVLMNMLAKSSGPEGIIASQSPYVCILLNNFWRSG